MEEKETKENKHLFNLTHVDIFNIVIMMRTMVIITIITTLKHYPVE
jgi:hypothetical protein